MESQTKAEQTRSQEETSELTNDDAREGSWRLEERWLAK